MSTEDNRSRRDFLSTKPVTLAALASLPVAAQGTTKEQAMTAIPAFQASETLKPLPFDPAKLNGLSERLVPQPSRAWSAPLPN